MRRVFSLKYFSPIILIILLFSIGLSLRADLPSLDSGFVLNGEEGKQITLPYYETNNDPTAMTVVLGLQLNSRTFSKLILYPDDCLKSLKIDGAIVSLENYTPQQLCEYAKGVELDFSKITEKLKFTLELQIQNRLGSGHGLRLEVRQHDVLVSVKGIAFATLFVALVCLVASILGCRGSTLAVIFLALCLRLVYLSYTPYFERTHDVLESGGHWDYIEFIAEKGEVPHFLDGWEYHQPPLYYSLSALFFKIFNVSAFGGSTIFLQFLSLAFMAIFLIFSALIFERLLEKRYSLIATTLLCFWPSGVIHSVRTSNDVLSYGLSAVALWFVVNYFYSNKRKNLLGSGFTAMLGIATKLTVGPVLFAIAWIKVDYLFFVREKRRLRIVILSAIFILIGFVAAFYRSLPDYLSHDQNLVLGDTAQALNKHLFVGNESWRYLSFGINHFTKLPYANPWKKDGERKFFWSYLLKTSLFGEFSFASPLNKTIAIYLSYPCLVILFVVLLKSMLVVGSGSSVERIMVIFFVVNMAMIFAYHYNVPAASNNEFRFVFPSLIPICYLFASAVQSLSSRVALYFVASAAFLWAAAVATFFVSLLWSFAVVA